MTKQPLPLSVPLVGTGAGADASATVSCADATPEAARHGAAGACAGPGRADRVVGGVSGRGGRRVGVVVGVGGEPAAVVQLGGEALAEVLGHEAVDEGVQTAACQK